MGLGKVHPVQKAMPYVKMEKDLEGDQPQPHRHSQPPQPFQVHPSAHRPLKRRKGGGNGCCCCCCLLLLILLLLVALVVVLWLDLQPKIPKVALQQANVNALNVIPPNATVHTFYMEADIQFAVQIINPNKKIAIIYDNIDIATSINNTQFAQGMVPGFVQETQNTTVLNSRLQVSHFPLNETLGYTLLGDIRNQDVPFVVQVAVKAKVSVPSWHYISTFFTVNVTCTINVNPPAGSQAAKVLGKTCSFSGS